MVPNLKESYNQHTYGDHSKLMRNFLKRIVNNDKRAKQLFRLYFDRNEISEAQFYSAIANL